MRWDRCTYVPPSGASLQQLAAALQDIHNRMFNLADGRIDGFNLSQSGLLGPGLQYRPATEPGKPPMIVASLAPLPPFPPPPPPPEPFRGPLTPGIRLKRDNDTGPAVGVEILVDPQATGASGSGSGDASICFVDAKDVQFPKRQIGRVIIDSSREAAPGIRYLSPHGATTIDTGGAFNVIFKRNGSEQLRLDGTGLLASVGLRPTPTATLDLGTTSLAWQVVYTRSVDTDGAQNLTLKRNATTYLTLDGTGLLAAKQVRFNTGLGAITQVLGPTDQNLTVEAPTGRSIDIVADASNDGGTFVRIRQGTDDCKLEVGEDYVGFGTNTSDYLGRFSHSNSADRTYTFQNRSGTIADDTDIAGRQPLDATLTALAGLATGADKVPYSTGTDTFSQRDIGTASAASKVPLADSSGDLAKEWFDKADWWAGRVGHRLSLTTGVPVTTTDVTGATSIYLVPMDSNNIGLFDTSGNMAVRAISEQTLALGTLSDNTVYDIFDWYDSGYQYEFVAWSSATARATELTRNLGVLVKVGTTYKTWRGSFKTTSTTTTADALAGRYLSNAYNQRRRPMKVIEAENSWTYDNSALRAANGSNANRLQFVIGFAGNPVTARVRAQAYLAVDGQGLIAGIGVNSTSSNSADIFTQTGTDDEHLAMMGADYQGFPGIGHHYLQWLETGHASVVTYYGDNGGTNFQSGIVGEVWA